MSRFARVYVEITNRCNLSCSFCAKTARPLRDMSPAEFSRVLDQLRPYTSYLYFHLMGEPLLHPQLGGLLERCAQQGFRVNLTTNGTRLDAVKDILLTARSLRKVGVSLHSYEANTANLPLESYLGQVLAFVREAQARGIICELRLWNGDSKTRPAQNTLNREILQQVFASFPPAPAEGALPQNGSVKLAERVFLGFAEIFDWPDLARADTQAQVFCHGLRDHFGVLADGTVVPCCLDSEGSIPLGNLFRQPLREILEGPRAREIYEGFSRRTAREPLCQRCGYARRF